MHFKRLSILLICLILIISPIIGDIYCYADDYDQWYQVTTTEQAAEAFRYYCKSRDLTIEGSALDAVTSFTTKMYTDLCNGVGLNMDAIQANLKYTTDQNGKVKFLLNKSGITAFNSLFAQLLHDYDLQVGDTDVNKLVHSGLYFTDDDGITCEVFDSQASSLASINNENTNYGTFYKYDTTYINLLIGDHANGYSDTLTFNCSEVTTVNQPFYYFTRTNNSNHWKTKTVTANSRQGYANGSIFWERIDYENDNTTEIKHTVIYYGYPCIARKSNTLYFGIYTCLDPANGQTNDSITETVEIEQGSTQNVTIYFVSTTINNNDYSENNYTTINEEGDTNNYYGDDEPDPDDPIPDNPSGGTPPNWDIGGGDGTASDGDGNTWNIHFPDFELPDLNIDWSISGLGDKFPFSIPFDMVALITALSAEPEAPHFEGTIDFGFTDWDYDIDLQPFDSVASACRIAELLLLVFGLILITRQIIKG